MQKAAELVLLALLLIVFCIPSTVVGYGGGGGGGGAGGGGAGGDGGGADNNQNPLFTMGPQASGGVSWTPNPNGADVMGSSIWDGRPENIQQGPYQPDKAVEDAEHELLSDYQSGNYTPQEVKEQLEWAQKVGIKLSPQAVKTLEAINKPPPPPKTPVKTSKKPEKPAKPSTLSSLASKWLKKHKNSDIKAQLRTATDWLEDQNKGKKSTKTTVGISYVKNIAKSWVQENLPPEISSQANDALDSLADAAKDLLSK